MDKALLHSTSAVSYAVFILLSSSNSATSHSPYQGSGTFACVLPSYRVPFLAPYTTWMEYMRQNSWKSFYQACTLRPSYGRVLLYQVPAALKDVFGTWI